MLAKKTLKNQVTGDPSRLGHERRHLGAAGFRTTVAARFGLAIQPSTPGSFRQIPEEYLRVLAYPKFELTSPEIRGVIEEELLPFIGRSKSPFLSCEIRTIPSSSPAH